MDERSKKLVEEARKWLASPEGKNSIEKSVKEAEEKSRKFSESRQIDPKILKEPFTV